MDCAKSRQSSPPGNLPDRRSEASAPDHPRIRREPGLKRPTIRSQMRLERINPSRHEPHSHWEGTTRMKHLMTSAALALALLLAGLPPARAQAPAALSGQ